MPDTRRSAPARPPEAGAGSPGPPWRTRAARPERAPRCGPGRSLRLGLEPPPAMPMADTIMVGERKGRRTSRGGCSEVVSPGREWISVASRASPPGQIREDGGQAAGQHGLPIRAGPPCRGCGRRRRDLQGALHVFLPLHVGKSRGRQSRPPRRQAAARLQRGLPSDGPPAAPLSTG